MLNPNLIDFETYRNNYQDLLDNKEDYFIFVRALTERNYDLFKNIINPKNLKRGVNFISYLQTDARGNFIHL